MVDEVQVGANTQIIDLRTGKLTRQGLLFLESLSSISTATNTNANDLFNHVAVNAGDGVRGHVEQADQVSDAASPTVLIESPDAIDLTTNNTLTNELKQDVNVLIGELNNTISTLNSLMAALRTAGIQAP